MATQLQGAHRYDRITGFFLLLATAKPVQLDPIEARDLLNALKGGAKRSQWAIVMITNP